MRSLLPLADPDPCCVPIDRAAMSVERAVELAAVLKAVAEPTRLRLLSLVAAHDDAEACVCDLTGPIGLSQPTVSHHLRILVDAGLMTRSKRGAWSFYALVPGALDHVLDQLGTVVRPSAAPEHAHALG